MSFEFAGREIGDPHEYTCALRGLGPGDRVGTVPREGERVTLPALPGYR